MTPHKYPPLPQAQRDDDDRIGEILDTVRRIEARDTSYLHATIKALEEENGRLREEIDRAGAEWRNAMAVKDKAMYDLALRVWDATNTPMADCLIRSHGVDVVRMTIVGNTVEVVVGEDDGDKVAEAIWNTVPINLTPVGKCEAGHDGHKIRFSRATSPSPRGRIFAEVVVERERQEAKFPGQRLPLVRPGTDLAFLRYNEERSREWCEESAKDGTVTNADVLREEVAEALLAMAEYQAGVGTKEAARAELIQVMAVCARILESEHFAEDNVVAEGGYTKVQARGHGERGEIADGREEQSMTVYIFDLRRLAKPTHGKPIAEGRPPRPHFDSRPSVKAKREAARTTGGIDRVLVHHWGVEVGVHDDLAFSDAAEAWALARRAAGLDHFGLPLRVGGAPYHVSVGCTSHGSGVVALVWPREAHTYHAGDENRRSIGVGVMGRFHRDDEEGDTRPGLPEAMAWALYLAAGLVRDPLDDLGTCLDSVTTEPVPAVRGADAWLLRGLPLPAGLPPVLCTTHSQSANKPHDPGLYVVRHGIAPAVRAGLLRVEPGWHTGGGNGWPRWWSDALLAPLPRPE